MSMKLSARVKKKGQSATGMSLGIGYGGGWRCVVLWDDGSLSAELISTIMVNPVDRALVYEEIDDINSTLIEQYSRKAD